MAAAAQEIQSPRLEDEAPQERREPFAAVPTEIARDSRYSIGARHLFTLLTSYAWGDPYCYPSKPRLAGDLGCDERTLEGYLDELVFGNNKGAPGNLVRIIPRPGYSSAYVLAVQPAREAKLERKRKERQADQPSTDTSPPASSEGGTPRTQCPPTKNHRTNKQSCSVGPAEPPSGQIQNENDDHSDNDTKHESREGNASRQQAKRHEVKELVSQIVSRLKTSGIALTEGQRSRIGGELKTVRAKQGSEILEETVEVLIEAFSEGEALYPLQAAGIAKPTSSTPAGGSEEATEINARTEGYEWWFGEQTEEEQRRREAQRRREDYEWLFGD